MRLRRDHHSSGGQRGRTTARWRGATIVVATAALSLTVGTVPASATDVYTVTATIPVGSYSDAVAVDPAVGTVYVSNGESGTSNGESGTVSVIDAATNTVTATIPVGSHPSAVAVDPAAGTVYVTNSVDGTVSVIDEATSTVTAIIPVGSDPYGVAADPAAGTVYVTNFGDGTVSVIDAVTNTVTATIPVGSDPSGVAVDPSTHAVYVVNELDGTVSVISAVAGQAPAITSAGSTATGLRSPFGFTVTTTGDPAPALTETGALPSGVTFTDNGNGTASLSGTAAAGTAGRYPVTITASNGVGSPATQAFTLKITTAASAPAITSDPAYTDTFGVPFNFTVTTTGYPLPKFSQTGLPPGIHLSGNGDGTAAISGTPAGKALGPYTVTLTAKNSAGTATQSFTLTIPKAPAITRIRATTATTGTPMDLTITAVSYPAPVLTESGTLPTGLSFTSTGNGQAAISGTPAAGTAGRYAITITATNQLGAYSQTFTLKIRS